MSIFFTQLLTRVVLLHPRYIDQNAIFLLHKDILSLLICCIILHLEASIKVASHGHYFMSLSDCTARNHKKKKSKSQKSREIGKKWKCSVVETGASRHKCSKKCFKLFDVAEVKCFECY